MAGGTGRRLALGVAVASAVTVVPAMAAGGPVVLVSTADDGAKANASSSEPSVSADASRVAFSSRATNLDAGDTDVEFDVYVKDVVTGELILASAADDGTKLTGGYSMHPSLSSDGTKVAFYSTAANPGEGDTDTDTDVYVKDLTTGALTLASTSNAGLNLTGYLPSLSADGNRVAFTSIFFDPVGHYDIYVRDLVTGALTLASTADDGTQADGESLYPSMSADGSRVAFYSRASNLDEGDTDTVADVYVKDLVTGALTLASTADNGTKGDLDSLLPRLSADGTRVAFQSTARNLGEADTDAWSDVYVKDLPTGALTLASTADDGTKSDGSSSGVRLSADGTHVAFDSTATNLGEGDTDTDLDVYVKNLLTGELVLGSTAPDGTKSNGNSERASLSADGTQVGFVSSASNLSTADTDTVSDVYLRNLAAERPADPAPTCAGQSATVYVAGGQIVGGPDAGHPYAGELRGTDGSDVIVGTPENDQVVARGGNDVVCSVGGDDTALGGPGGDRLFGGAGSDALDGAAGRDTVNGGSGPDTLTGGMRADRFVGGKGTDTATDYDRAAGDTIIGVP